MVFSRFVQYHVLPDTGYGLPDTGYSVQPQTTILCTGYGLPDTGYSVQPQTAIPQKGCVMSGDYKIVLQRIIGKTMRADRQRSHLQQFASTALKGTRGKGWTYKITRIEDPKRNNDQVIHRATVLFDTTHQRESVHEKWSSIVRKFAEVACSGALKSNPWRVISPTGFDAVAEEAIKSHVRAGERKERMNEPKTLGEVNLVPAKGEFDRIFGREAQLRRILDALHLAQRTEWQKRNNVLLDGPPGSGKSECMMAIAKMLGAENDAWRWFDATSMTKAGAIEEIIANSVVPPVLFIEEIEKCEENALRWLLGVMDVRGQIRRTNYRVGNDARNVRMLVIASANDVKLLKEVMSGALYSRFQNKIYCPEPDRLIMRKILEREIEEIKGKTSWIDPTLQFAFDKWCITDPREVINIMSCGGDRLLTGDYQKDHEETMHPYEKSMLLAKKGN